MIKHLSSLVDFINNRLTLFNAARGAGVLERVGLLLRHLRDGLHALVASLPDEAYIASLLDPLSLDTFIPAAMRNDKWALLERIIADFDGEEGEEVVAVAVEEAMDLDPPEDTTRRGASTRARPGPVVPKLSYDSILSGKYLAKGAAEADTTPYRNLRPISEKLDVGDWWRQHEAVYPLHAKAARRYLAIPATSAPSERIFSTGGRILDKRRAALKPDSVRELLLVHDNIERVEDVAFQDWLEADDN